MKKYFNHIESPSDGFCSFRDTPIPGCYTPGYFDVFKSTGMTPESFCDKANSLFEKLLINVPEGYIVHDPSEFAICISCCIVMHEKFGIDVQKIIKSELIDGRESKDLHHASSLASVALYHLNQGLDVEILKEKKNKSNPDLIIDGKECEVKVIQEADWIRDYDPETGKTEEHELLLDVCYDVGNFLSKKGSGYKGIKQAQILFADLGLKSIGWLKKVLEDDETFDNEFPKLQANRVIFFARQVLNFTGFYIDFDPRLWKLIKEKSIKHRFAVLPFKQED